MPFEQKIIVRNKSRYFDVAAVKHHSQHTRSWLQCKWEAFCENYLPYLLCARDKLDVYKRQPIKGCASGGNTAA